MNTFYAIVSLSQGFNRRTDSDGPYLSSVYAFGWGYLQVLKTNFEVPVCQKNWTWLNSQVACKMLGFEWGMQLLNYYNKSKMSSVLSISPTEGNQRISSNFSCDGTENSLLDCGNAVDTSEKFSTLQYCPDEDVLFLQCSMDAPIEDERYFYLVDNGKKDKFIPIIHQHNQWRTFCAKLKSDIDMDEVSFICKTLGFSEKLVETAQAFTLKDLNATKADFHIDSLITGVSNSTCDENDDIIIYCTSEEFDESEVCTSDGESCLMDSQCCGESTCILEANSTRVCFDPNDVLRPIGMVLLYCKYIKILYSHFIF